MKIEKLTKPAQDLCRRQGMKQAMNSIDSQNKDLCAFSKEYLQSWGSSADFHPSGDELEQLKENGGMIISNHPGHLDFFAWLTQLDPTKVILFVSTPQLYEKIRQDFPEIEILFDSTNYNKNTVNQEERVENSQKIQKGLAEKKTFLCMGSHSSERNPQNSKIEFHNGAARFSQYLSEDQLIVFSAIKKDYIPKAFSKKNQIKKAVNLVVNNETKPSEDLIPVTIHTKGMKRDDFLKEQNLETANDIRTENINTSYNNHMQEFLIPDESEKLEPPVLSHQKDVHKKFKHWGFRTGVALGVFGSLYNGPDKLGLEQKAFEKFHKSPQHHATFFADRELPELDTENIEWPFPEKNLQDIGISIDSASVPERFRKNCNNKIAQTFLKEVPVVYQEIQEDFDLTDEEMETVIKMSYAVLGTESNFGKSSKLRAKIKKYLPLSVHLAKLVLKGGEISKGLTQLRLYSNLPEEVIEKYELSNNLWKDSAIAARATMLAHAANIAILKLIQQNDPEKINADNFVRAVLLSYNRGITTVINGDTQWFNDIKTWYVPAGEALFEAINIDSEKLQESVAKTHS
jgi:hypothetical protein